MSSLTTIDKLRKEAAAFAKRKKTYISNNKQLQFRFNNKLSAPAHPRKLPPLPLPPLPPLPSLPSLPPPTGGATAPAVEKKSDFQTMSMLGEQQFAPPVKLIYNRRAELTFENVIEDVVKIFDLLHTDVNIVIKAGEKLPSPLHPRYFDFWISIVRMGYPELTHKYRMRVKAYLMELAKHRMEVMGVMQGPGSEESDDWPWRHRDRLVHRFRWAICSSFTISLHSCITS